MRSVLMTAVLILLALVGTLHAADKSPQQILGGKPAATSSGSSRYYDGHGSFEGRSITGGSTTRLYDSKGSTSGNSTRFYDPKGSFSGSAENSGSTTRYYDSSGRPVGSKTK